MKKKFFLTILMLVELSPLYAQSSGQEAGYVTAMRLRPNVVAILTTKAGEMKETGFGFIVALRSNDAYIVTAKHVIVNCDSILVSFFGYESQTNVAEVVPLQENALDIALVKVHAPENFFWERTCYSELCLPNTRTFYIGQGGTWYVPTGNAAGSINEVTVNNVIKLDMQVMPGTSGAPLINQSGIIGIITRHSFPTSTALHINQVKHIIKNVSHQPFDLETNQVLDASEQLKVVMPTLVANLKVTTDEMEAAEILASIREELANPHRSRQEFTKSKDRFADAVAHRLKNTMSMIEINNIFQTIDAYVAREPALVDNIIILCNNVLEEEFLNYKLYLGDLLLEGYKKCYIRNGYIRPEYRYTREIYQFVIDASEQQQIRVNMLLAQVQLFSDGILKCDGNIRVGPTMQPSDKAKIPVASMAVKARRLVKISPFKTTLLTTAHPDFQKRKKAISTFSMKLELFRRSATLMAYTGNPLLYEAPVFKHTTCNECEAFNYVFDDRFHQ